MKKINEIELRDPVRNNQRLWYSYIQGLIENAPFSTIELRLTVKNGSVMTIKAIEEKSVSIHNDA
ncbi:MAG: hypothetical protein Q8Q08_12775 [Candidatus Omnitrophota bacterium]|nr:hypothetical protein [Candidatus Omnitrophota bacterium]